MKTIHGIGASDGIAIGPAHRYLPAPLAIERHEVEHVAAEVQRLDVAAVKVEAELAEIQARLEAEVGHKDAAIFEAHRLFLSDPAFLGRAKEVVEAERLNAEAAVEAVMGELRQTFEAMTDEYFRQRAADVDDVGRRLIRTLLDLPQPSLKDLPRPCIVVADDLTPSDTAQMDRARVLGFCTARGGRTAHAAILARSLGLPAVVGAGAGVLDIAQDNLLIMDGEGGLVIEMPDEATIRDYETRRAEFATWRAAARIAAREPAVTRDGQRVEVVANIGGVGETTAVLENGGEGVGLLRTEFLYLDRATPPDEEEQAAAYGTIAEALGQRPLVIRTLDIGGDKVLPYLPMQPEDNPFLGHRGIRLCLAAPELFKVQLRAILRAALGHNTKIMFPMVATVGEVRCAKAVLEEARAELEARGVRYGQPEIGIMVEVPAAAVAADVLAREVDFFSIGTNDLTQYTLAADRTNALVQSLADALHPAVLRLISETIRCAHEVGIWVGLCGELAGDPEAAPVLLGLGLDEFSMAVSSIPTVKAEIRKWSLAEAKTVAEAALRQEDAVAVRTLLRERVRA